MMAEHMGYNGKLHIKIGDQWHDIEAASLTLLCPAANMHEQIIADGHVALDLEACLAHADQIEKLHPETEKWFRTMFPDFPGKIPEDVRDGARYASLGTRHALGLIDLSFRLVDARVGVHWKYPEAGLHPAAQVVLADIAIELMTRCREHDKEPPK